MRGVCDLPKVKCSECPNQAFTPVDDRVVLDHLQGRHVLGVYPLLEDERCWLLAIDFDKSCWQEDVGAFAETCRAMEVPMAVERSRSGDGAHTWFFFEAPVAATLARKMGCYLLTETMSRRHQLSMGSYDRLFPNQDTMPRGGFGNLIALPLQYEPRQQGNTVFVDQSFQPYDDQWSSLASLRRIAPPFVESLAAEALRRGLVVGVRFAGPADDEESTPWRRRPSGRPRQVANSAPLPRVVRAVLAQRLFVDKEGLPSPLLNEIKRLAAFQNPDFYKKQSLRLSKGTLAQYTGRLHRLHPRKLEVRIFDYVDREVHLLARMFERRLRTYRAIGYVRGELPVSGAEGIRERTVEYDKEAAWYFAEEE